MFSVSTMDFCFVVTTKLVKCLIDQIVLILLIASYLHSPVPVQSFSGLLMGFSGHKLYLFTLYICYQIAAF